MNSTFTVLVTEGSDEKPLQWLREQVNVIEIPYDDPKLDQFLPQAEGMVVRTYTKVNSTPCLLARRSSRSSAGAGFGLGID